MIILGNNGCHWRTGGTETTTEDTVRRKVMSSSKSLLIYYYRDELQVSVSELQNELELLSTQKEKSIKGIMIIKVYTITTCMNVRDSIK